MSDDRLMSKSKLLLHDLKATTTTSLLPGNVKCLQELDFVSVKLKNSSKPSERTRMNVNLIDF